MAETEQLSTFRLSTYRKRDMEQALDLLAARGFEACRVVFEPGRVTVYGYKAEGPPQGAKVTRLDGFRPGERLPK